MMSLQDIAHQPEAETSANVLLGRIKIIEDSRHVLRSDAAAVVHDRNAHTKAAVTPPREKSLETQ